MKMCKLKKVCIIIGTYKSFLKKTTGEDAVRHLRPSSQCCRGVCCRYVVAGYCWSATSVMGLPMQELGIWMRSMAQTVGATSTM